MKQKIILLIAVVALMAQFSIAQLSTLPASIVRDYKSYGWIYFNPDSAYVGQLFTTYKSSFFNNADDSMGVIKAWEDSLLHFEHFRYQQYYKGIPVEGCEFTEHTDHSYLVYANGKICSEIYRIYSENIISERDAIEYLLDGGEYWEEYLNSLTTWDLSVEGYSIDTAIFAWEDSLWEADLKTMSGDSNATYFPTGELIFGLVNPNHIQYDMDEENYKLVWKFEVVCIFPDIHVEVYVDAITGAIVKVHNLTCYDGPANIPGHGSQTLDTRHRGWPNNDYVLETDNGNYHIHTKIDGGSLWSLTAEVDDDDDDWGSTQQLATAPHWMVTKAWTYFSTVHGRQGMHNNNMVRVRTDENGVYGGHYDKVAGFNTIKVGYYAGNIYSANLEVLAHEFTHGVDEHEGKLKYQFESGALDESFADIFGFLTRRWVTGVVNWHIGVPAALPRDRRNMQYPNSLGIHLEFDGTYVTEHAGQPDTYGGDYFYDLPYGNDAGGVHVNSGIMNHWFYMLCMGESGTNDLSNGYSVTGIGIDKAAVITYYNFVNNMQKLSQYDDAMEGAITAAELYYGTCSFEHIETQNAWYAAGLGSPSGCEGATVEEFQMDFTVYPNPAIDNLVIHFKNTDEKVIQIYSINGKLLKTFNNVSEEKYLIDVSGLANGTYIINVVGSSTGWKKFIKQ